MAIDFTVLGDTLDEIRTTMCYSQLGIPISDEGLQHIGRLGRLAEICDLHRPLDMAGEHGDLHTTTCGCEDAPVLADTDPRVEKAREVVEAASTGWGWHKNYDGTIELRRRNRRELVLAAAETDEGVPVLAFNQNGIITDAHLLDTDEHPDAALISQAPELIASLVAVADEQAVLLGELREKILFLRTGCCNLDREELVQRITAVGRAECASGFWVSQRERELEKELSDVRYELRETAAELADAHERIAAYEQAEQGT